MKNRCLYVSVSVVVAALFLNADVARAQAASTESAWSIDAGVGLDFPMNGNVNSGVIGRLQGLSTAILPPAGRRW